MSKRNVYEILNDFKNATTKQERIQCLLNNSSYALKNVLQAVFNPNIQFTLDKAPEFNRTPIPEGLSYSHMTEALQRAYLFQKDNPRVPAGLTEKRKQEILIQILESLEEPEADIFVRMLQKDLKVPYLTANLVKDAFPDLLP